MLLCALSLSSCALSLQRGAEAEDKSPLYIHSPGKEGYFFFLRLTRAWEEHGGIITQNPSAAKVQLSLTGPTCEKRTLLRDNRGDKTDFFVLCQVRYSIQSNQNKEGDARQGILNERFILSLEENLSAYYRKERELEEEVLEGLAQKLILALKTVD